MGDWGPGVFDNDTAADWALRIENSTDMSLIESTIEKVLKVGDEYLPAEIAREAYAAIEVVARLKSKGGDKNAFSEPVDKWVEENKFDISSSLLDSCEIAIDKIVGNNSELNNVWRKNEKYYGQWKQGVIDLKKRISS